MSGFSQKYVHKWAWQNKHFRLDSLINSVDYLVFCLSAQGTYSQRSRGAPEGTSWGRHLHAWGHPEGERSSACLTPSWHLLHLCSASRTNTTWFRELNGCCVTAWRSFFIHCMLPDLLVQTSFSFLFPQASEQIYHGNTEGVSNLLVMFSNFYKSKL